MEESFINNSPNMAMMWGGNPHSTEDTNIRPTNTASDMAGAINSLNPRDSDMATLIGVVPEPESLEKLSDDQLMSAVGEGSSSAFEMLYDRHIGSCFGLAVRIVHESSLAEDIVQEVFTKLWSRPDIFSPGRGAFHPWLLTLVRNQALDKLRKMKSQPVMYLFPLYAENAGSDTLADLLYDAAPTAYDQAWTKEVASVVNYALRQLPVSEYQTISLAYFGGLTQREIADKLNRPLGTVKTHTRSALRRLHNLLVGQSALFD